MKDEHDEYIVGLVGVHMKCRKTRAISVECVNWLTMTVMGGEN